MRNRTSSFRALLTGGTGGLAGLTLVWLTGMQPLPAQAQDAFKTNDTSQALQEVIVTARRRSENLQLTPVSVAAVSGASLERQGVIQLDQITNIPNVNFDLQPGYMNTMVAFIRGIGEQDPVLTNDQPISEYVDGVLMPGAIGSMMQLIVPQQIEVLRGPQGSLFGRNTTGGAILISSQEPANHPEAQLKVGYASNAEETARGVLDTGEIGNTGLKARISVLRHTMNGYVRNALTSDENFWPGAENTRAFLLDIHGDEGKVNFDLRADYTHQYSEILSGQTAYPSPAVISYFGNSPGYGGNPFLYSGDRLGTLDIYKAGPLSVGWWQGVSLTVNVPVSDAFNIKSITAWRTYMTDTQPSTTGQGLLYGPVLDPTTFTYGGVQRVTPYLLEYGLLGRNQADLSHMRQLTQEFQFTGDVGAHKYVAGLYALDQEYSEAYIAELDVLLPTIPGIGLPSYGGLNYAGRSQSFAAYGSDSYTPPILNGKLQLTGGVRYTVDRKRLDYLPLPPLQLTTADHFRRFSDVSGDFTARYRWTSDFMTYLRFANAYASGGFSGRDAPDAPGFEPQYANNYELGEKSSWFEHRLRVNGDVFFTTYNNMQITTFAPGLSSNGINASHVVNAGRARFSGTELDLTAVPGGGWEFNLNFGRVWPVMEEFLYQPTATTPPVNIANQAVFPYFSKTSYSAAAQYSLQPLPIGDLSVRVDFSHKSGMYFFPTFQFNPLNQAIKAGPQNYLNASINLAHIPSGWKDADLELNLYGQNLLNKEPRLQGVDYEIIPGYDYFATLMFARPRVLGVSLNARFGGQD